MANKKTDRWTEEALERGDDAAVIERACKDPSYLASRDWMGCTPLLTAINFDRSKVVDFLLSQGADPDVAVDDGYTCLLSAVESNDPKSLGILKLLVAAGADIHRTGTNGWTPLHMAASRGDVEKVKLLLEAGARVNERTEIDGDSTPLMEAASSGRAQAVRVLLDHGADPTMIYMFTMHTPLEMAEEALKGADPEVTDLMKELQDDLDVNDLLDIVDVDEEARTILEEEFSKIDLAEMYEQSANMIAQDGDHEEVIRILKNHRG